MYNYFNLQCSPKSLISVIIATSVELRRKETSFGKKYLFQFLPCRLAARPTWITTVYDAAYICYIWYLKALKVPDKHNRLLIPNNITQSLPIIQNITCWVNT